MPEEERERWLRQLDAGRRAPGMKAALFIAGAANDFVYEAELPAEAADGSRLFRMIAP